jgi:hypothetical protein
MDYRVEIDSVIVIKNQASITGVILVTDYSECACESNDQYLWFLAVRDTVVKVVDVLELSDLRASPSNKTVFWGNKHFSIDESPRAHFSVPIEINFDNVVRISPLLDQRGLFLAKGAFEAETNRLMKEMSKSSDTTSIKSAQQARRQFNDIIKGKTIRF